jgi:hypothetical protein
MIIEAIDITGDSPFHEREIQRDLSLIICNYPSLSFREIGYLSSLL